MDGPLSVTSMIDKTVESPKSSRRAIPAAQFHPPACARSLRREDIVQEVFYELVEANRLLIPIEHVTGWLFRVARIAITDLPQEESRRPSATRRRGRRRRAAAESKISAIARLPGRKRLYFRNVLLDELEFAIGELTDEQREVFVAHELKDAASRSLSAATGVT